jgi:hypothetical protein
MQALQCNAKLGQVRLVEVQVIERLYKNVTHKYFNCLKSIFSIRVPFLLSAFSEHGSDFLIFP